MTLRKIIHIDLDAFYASVEQLDHPEYRGKPVIVGGEAASRGVVATASYEARKFGVRSAISTALAKRLCPHGIFLKCNFKRYREISDQIEAMFLEVTPLVEFLSLDEAFLDVTENSLGEPLAKNIALFLKNRIKNEIGLTASAGVSSVKFVAKIASDLKKPDGLVVIPPEKIDDFVRDLPIRKLWSVGPSTAKVLNAMGIEKVGDIRLKTAIEMKEALGKHGEFIYELAHGRDARQVTPDREPKSRGSEETFRTDILDVYALVEVIENQAKEVGASLQRLQKQGKTITLKVRYSDFETITRSRTLSARTDHPDSIAQTAIDLLTESTEAGQRPVRLIGISVSGFGEIEEEAELPEQLWFPFIATQD